MPDDSSRLLGGGVRVSEILGRASGVWIGLGFTFLPILFLVALLFNINPHVWRSLPDPGIITRSAPETSIAWGEVEEKNPPLEYIGEKIAFVAVLTEKPEIDSFWDLFVTPKSRVEWAWEYTVKNLTSESQRISISYFVSDANQSHLSEASQATAVAQPQETVTLRGRGFLDYDRVSSIAGGDWQISYSPE